MDAASAYRAHNAFRPAGLAAFPHHGPRNLRLGVDVVDTGRAEDARILILLLPWAIEGLIFRTVRAGPAPAVRRIPADQ